MRPQTITDGIKRQVYIVMPEQNQMLRVDVLYHCAVWLSVKVMSMSLLDDIMITLGNLEVQNACRFTFSRKAATDGSFSVFCCVHRSPRVYQGSLS
ncbi:hypothetical protein I79_016301 [Cricetulus griseus]|uniref:Uncharacterized protein n=1 Tax=Cricetulus griseus TaxID=10029 RepID=G3HZ06_CRIGR|nr:hypothetical protein I79_016301 [Cricetulus griseus]